MRRRGAFSREDGESVDPRPHDRMSKAALVSCSRRRFCWFRLPRRPLVRLAPVLHLTSVATEEKTMRKRVAVVLAGSLGVVGLVGCDDAGDSSATTGDKV